MKTQTLEYAKGMDIDGLAALPPVPAEDDAASPAGIDAETLAKLQSEIDVTDTSTIVRFGSGAQAELTRISQEMLGGVKNKDAGPAGDSLRDIVTTIRGFSIAEGDARAKPRFWERLLGRAAPFARFMARYETVQGQIDTVTEELLRHEYQLMKDVRFLDQLYEKTLEFYRSLGLYIAAGDALVARLDAEDIPAAEAAVEAAPEERSVIKAQELRDLRSARDDIERRVHDLRLTRQVTMQALPSMRLVQENDKSLIVKINSTLVNTVPLWETQLAQAITIQRSEEAADALRGATDLTNDLLTSNAANLRQANAKVRTEMERGVFDIEAVRQANDELVATIEESLAIADAGKAQRSEAEGKLGAMEQELRATLTKAKA